MKTNAIPQYLESDLAFKNAFDSGRLSVDPKSPVFAGNFMYMGTTNGKDAFKNIMTREYLP